MAADKVHIKIIVDAEADGAEMDSKIRALSQVLEASGPRTENNFNKFRSYFSGITHHSGVEYDVSQWDTAQSFLDKTGFLTPETATASGASVRTSLSVLPPTEEDIAYRKTLRNLFFDIEQERQKDAAESEQRYEQRKLEIQKRKERRPGYKPPAVPEQVEVKAESAPQEPRFTRPEDIDSAELQKLYRKNLSTLPKDSKYRQYPQFRAAMEERARLAFTSVFDHIAEHPLPPEGEKTVFLYVGADGNTNDVMQAARSGKEAQDAGRFELHATTPRNFRKAVQNIVSAIEKEQPERVAFRVDPFEEQSKSKRRPSRVQQPVEEPLTSVRGFSYTSSLSNDVSSPLKVEITLDTGAFSHEMRDLLRQTREFFGEVKARTGWDAEVIQREPTQIFHEKTGFLSLEQAPKDVSLWPERHREIGHEIQSGEYRVDAPGEVEMKYKDVLRDTVFAAGKRGESVERFEAHGVRSPSDISDDLLQSLYDNQTPFRDRSHPFRQSEEFQKYTQERANSGEEAMAEFTRNRPEPEQRVVAFFVSKDHGAIRGMQSAGLEASKRYPGKLRVNSVHSEDMKEALSQLVNEVRRALPECADIPFPPADNRFTDKVNSDRRQAESGFQSR